MNTAAIKSSEHHAAVAAPDIAGAAPSSERMFSTDHLMSDLKGRSVRGGAVTASAQAVKFALQFTSIAVLARLLTPGDFGLVAMVSAVIGFVALFKDLGLSMATVQRAQINHAQVSTLFWINVGLSIVLAGVIAALAPAVVWFYGEPRLLWIVLAIAGTFVFGGLMTQHTALLRRQMRFTALAGIEVVSMAVGIAVGIVMAWWGFGYWSLVAMGAAGGIANVILVWIFSPWRPGLPRRGAGVMPMLKFGGNLTGFSVVNYLGRNVDNVLIGWWWGAGPLGLYTKAYALLLMPIKQITAPFAAVAVPALSRLQTEPEQYRRSYCGAINAIAHLSIPMIAVAAALSEELIYTVLGTQWIEAGRIFKLLALAAIFQPVLNTVGWVCISTGTTKRMMQAACMCVPLFILSFVVGLPWGPVGVAACYAVAVNAWVLPGFAWCLRGSPVKLMDVIRASSRATIIGAAIYAAILLSQIAYSQGGEHARLIVGATVALGAWGIMMIAWTEARREVQRLFGLLKHLKSKKAGASPAPAGVGAS